MLSRPVPHLVKARLPAYLSLSLCSEGKQTRPTYTRLEKHLATFVPILTDVSLKSRSQVNWGESSALFVSQPRWPHVSVRLTFFQNTAYGPAFVKNNRMKCQNWSARGGHVITLPEMTLCMSVSHPMGVHLDKTTDWMLCNGLFKSIFYVVMTKCNLFAWDIACCFFCLFFVLLLLQ